MHFIHSERSWRRTLLSSGERSTISNFSSTTPSCCLPRQAAIGNDTRRSWKSPRVTDFLVSGDDRWLAVSQFEPTEEARRTLKLQRESRLVIDTPIHFTADGSLKVTCLGSDKTFGKLFDDIGEMESITAEILAMGDYDPDESSFGRMFTSRQEEVLEAAVDLGYYNEPRQATLEDIAEVVGIAPTTAGEHLRKVEERVFNEIVHRSA